jgi:hyperosmotically inducible periplasmic protein
MQFKLTAGLALAIALGACTAQQQQSAQNDAQQLASSAPDAAKNGYLTTAVAAKLATVDVDSTTNVRTSANAGVITLSGEARTTAARDAYVQAAKSVSGVVSVRDALRINPKLRGVREQTGDAALAAQVAAAIAAQAGVNVFHVDTTAHDGTVTLAGSVPHASVVRTIVETARGVSGVHAVVNHLVVAR